MGEKPRRTTVFLSDDQRQTLRRIAFEEERPVAEFVREAIDAWIEKRRQQEVKSNHA